MTCFVGFRGFGRKIVGRSVWGGVGHGEVGLCDGCLNINYNWRRSLFTSFSSNRDTMRRVDYIKMLQRLHVRMQAPRLGNIHHIRPYPNDIPHLP